MGVFDFIGTTGSGWLSDRWNNRYLLTWYYGLRGLSLLFLPFALNHTALGLPLFAVFYGLDWIATVPPTVRLTTNAFGQENGPVMFGWIVAAHHAARPRPGSWRSGTANQVWSAPPNVKKIEPTKNVTASAVGPTRST